MLKTKNYELSYSQLPFENTLKQYRNKKIFEVFERYTPNSILEIGSGPHPLFTEYKDFKDMTVVEPGMSFFKEAVSLAEANPNVKVINNLFENVVDEFSQKSFDVIVIGGFLHEIDDPENFLTLLKKVCNKNTVIHSFVPNARSFHRLLAYEMQIIKSIYQKSEHDEIFQRRSVYEVATYCELFTKAGFNILDSGTYFIKPFTHEQMQKLITDKIIDFQVLDGLDKMIKYLPGLGAEIFVTCSLN